MKKIISFVIFCFLSLHSGAQILTMANKPSQTTSKKGIETGPSVYGVFVGRTACQELLAELNMGVNTACTKRKVGITLYHDAVSHEPTTYVTNGFGKWTGKGKWHILRGTPTDATAVVLQLELDANISLFLLKGDDNVLFILDRNRNFLIGNANYSYTLNRAAN